MLQSSAWVSVLILVIMYLFKLAMIEGVDVLHDCWPLPSSALEPSLVHFRRPGQAVHDDSPGIAGRRLVRVPC